MNFATFFAGIAMATFAASGLFFLKFWRASRDRFFLLFSFACLLFSIERILLFLMLPQTDRSFPGTAEAQFWIYLVRAAAFILILIAVVERNRSGSRRGN